MSTFWVLVNHALYLSKAGPDGRLNGSIVTDLMIVNSGLIALSFRQTNIFWVAIFPGGLEVLRALEAESRGAKKDATKGATFREILLRSWRTCEVYEAPAGEAYVEDYIKTAISLLIAALANPVTVVRTLIPYLLLLGSFAAFVVGNGGVVLGDKSNHVATLHLAQMLYIWPCFVFFFPSMLLPGVLEPLVPLGRVSSFIRLAKINNFPRIAVITMVSAITLLIVHFNTIIHPFTLADNRHYVFYVFRWTILRHPMIKYLLTPIYLLSGWAVLRATSGKKSGHDDPRAPALPRPAAPPKSECGTTTTSLVMVWLASTALSLISAPLVEPRYYIMPLITWRLYLLPSETVMEADQHQESRKDTKGSVSSGKQSQQPRRQKASQPSSWIKLLERHNARLWLESLWFLAINMVTGYVFLYNGFAWPQEPGKVQRFMW
ncbi:MAG: glucosyltransferase [Sclerophora amabilis]|nr:MAG: glucosyltransferase [Sclerophora amabilis]